ncbi:hypothetical protein D3C85_1566890 [compost metagenome]
MLLRQFNEFKQLLYRSHTARLLLGLTILAQGTQHVERGRRRNKRQAENSQQQKLPRQR